MHNNPIRTRMVKKAPKKSWILDGPCLIFGLLINTKSQAGVQSGGGGLVDFKCQSNSPKLRKKWG